MSIFFEHVHTSCQKMSYAHYQIKAQVFLFSFDFLSLLQQNSWCWKKMAKWWKSRFEYCGFLKKMQCWIEFHVKPSFLLKVRQFQNEFVKSSFLPKFERKIVRISALCSEGRNLDNFLFVFWEKRWLHKFILKLSDL